MLAVFVLCFLCLIVRAILVRGLEMSKSARVVFSTYKLMKFYNKYSEFTNNILYGIQKYLGYIGLFTIGLFYILIISGTFIPYVILKRIKVRWLDKLSENQVKHYARLCEKLKIFL